VRKRGERDSEARRMPLPRALLTSRAGDPSYNNNNSNNVGNDSAQISPSAVATTAFSQHQHQHHHRQHQHGGAVVGTAGAPSGGGGGGSRKRRLNRLATSLVVVGLAWSAVVWREHLFMTATTTTTTLSTTTKISSPSSSRTGGGAANKNENNNNVVVVGNGERGQQQHPPPSDREPPADDGDAKKNRGSEVAGTLNTLPLERRRIAADESQQQQPLRSRVDCIRHRSRRRRHSGGNETSADDDNSWLYTSCHFTNLCFDFGTKEYVLLTSGTDDDDDKDLKYAHSQGLAIGGYNPRWDMSPPGYERGGSWKVRWFPSLRSSSDVVGSSYLALPDDVVWMPIHSFGGHNVGHLLWDDFYPLFRLAQLFGYVPPLAEDDDTPQHEHPEEGLDPSYRWLVMRHVLNEALYASCDIRRNKRMQCTENYVKFLKLLDVDPRTFSSNRRAVFEPTLPGGVEKSSSSPPPPLICARHGLAGIGMLTDHGVRDHGWQTRQSWIPHNYGHARTFYEFREFVLKNIRQEYNLRTPSTFVPRPDEPLRITLSLLSSRDYSRRLDFEKQIRALRSEISPKEAAIYPVTLWNMTVAEQLQVSLDSHIWISACGGASMTSTFLRRHSSVILFHHETGGLDFAGDELHPNKLPARLDWDLLHNSHLRVHWMPIGTMDSPEQLELFVRLIRHEMALIRNL